MPATDAPTSSKHLHETARPRRALANRLLSFASFPCMLAAILTRGWLTRPTSWRIPRSNSTVSPARAPPVLTTFQDGVEKSRPAGAGLVNVAGLGRASSPHPLAFVWPSAPAWPAAPSRTSRRSTSSTPPLRATAHEKKKTWDGENRGPRAAPPPLKVPRPSNEAALQNRPCVAGRGRSCHEQPSRTTRKRR